MALSWQHDTASRAKNERGLTSEIYTVQYVCAEPITVSAESGNVDLGYVFINRAPLISLY